MKLRAPSFFWLVVFILASLALYTLRDMLLPFAAGLALAYLLSPVVDKMSGKGLSRSWSAMILIGGFLVTTIGVLAMILPSLTREAASLATRLPLMITQVQTALTDKIPPALLPYLSSDGSMGWASILQDHLSGALNLGSGVMGQVASGGSVALSILMFIALMPVVAYFMMKEWLHIKASLQNLWPRPSAEKMQEILGEIDIRIAGFVRGQLIVSLLLATYYSFALWLVGIQYGFLIGALGGILSMIPFVGSVFVLASTVLMALLQMPEQGTSILMWGVGAVVLGQLTEANFITPKIVGDRVGLHPLWIIFALMAGGHLMGFLGMLLAVPTAAALAVLIKQALLWYKTSVYYQGSSPAPLPPPKDRVS